MSSRALELLGTGTPEDKIKEMLRLEFAAGGVSPKANSVNAAVRRAKDKLSPRP